MEACRAGRSACRGRTSGGSCRFVRRESRRILTTGGCAAGVAANGWTSLADRVVVAGLADTEQLPAVTFDSVSAGGRGVPWGVGGLLVAVSLSVVAWWRGMDAVAEHTRGWWVAGALTGRVGGVTHWPTWYPEPGLGEALGGFPWAAALHPIRLPWLVLADREGAAAGATALRVLVAWVCLWIGVAGFVSGRSWWSRKILCALAVAASVWGPGLLASAGRDVADGLVLLPLALAARRLATGGASARSLVVVLAGTISLGGGAVCALALPGVLWARRRSVRRERTAAGTARCGVRLSPALRSQHRFGGRVPPTTWRVKSCGYKEYLRSPPRCSSGCATAQGVSLQAFAWWACACCWPVSRLRRMVFSVSARLQARWFWMSWSWSMPCRSPSGAEGGRGRDLGVWCCCGTGHALGAGAESSRRVAPRRGMVAQDQRSRAFLERAPHRRFAVRLLVAKAREWVARLRLWAVGSSRATGRSRPAVAGVGAAPRGPSG